MAANTITPLWGYDCYGDLVSSYYSFLSVEGPVGIASFAVKEIQEQPGVPGRAFVLTGFTGEPRRIERDQNEDWRWFDLDDLPTELALPAELALGEYLKGRSRDREWSDVEVQWQRSTYQPEQLRLGGQFGQPDDATSEPKSRGSTQDL